MTRTTIDIDAPLLSEIKRMQKQGGKSLGETISSLLADALAQRKSRRTARPKLAWISKDMAARVDVDDKDAVWAVLDEDAP
jgi:hypothetical protein